MVGIGVVLGSGLMVGSGVTLGPGVTPGVGVTLGAGVIVPSFTATFAVLTAMEVPLSFFAVTSTV